MIYRSLVAVARNGGSVRWERSGIVERLTLVKDGRVMASRALDGSREHLIGQHRGEYFCEPVSRDQWVCVGDLFK